MASSELMDEALTGCSPTALERDRSGPKIVPPMRWRRRESLRDHACAPRRDNHLGRSPARTIIDQRRRVIDHLRRRGVPSTVAGPAPVRGRRAGGNRGQDESSKHRASDLARDLGHCRCSGGPRRGAHEANSPRPASIPAGGERPSSILSNCSLDQCNCA